MKSTIAHISAYAAGLLTSYAPEGAPDGWKQYAVLGPHGALTTDGIKGVCCEHIAVLVDKVYVPRKALTQAAKTGQGLTVETDPAGNVYLNGVVITSPAAHTDNGAGFEKLSAAVDMFLATSLRWARKANIPREDVAKQETVRFLSLDNAQLISKNLLSICPDVEFEIKSRVDNSMLVINDMYFLAKAITRC